MRHTGLVFLILLASPLARAQQNPPPPQADDAKHDITMVDPAPLGGAIAIPLPEADRKRLERYEIPELVGSRQALGSQLIEGHLPRPILDYAVHDAKIRQRISIFEGGLVVIDVAGAGAVIRKKLIIPDDALRNYLKAISPAALAAVRKSDLPTPPDNRGASLRVYKQGRDFEERAFDPMIALPKSMNDQVLPLQDLMRAVSQDRTVSNSIANYEPHVGDQLVGDDSKTYRVTRIITEGDIVELRCTSQPTTLYVAKRDLYNYFIGTRRTQ